jgi:hypothetical protein
MTVVSIPATSNGSVKELQAFLNVNKITSIIHLSYNNGYWYIVYTLNEELLDLQSPKIEMKVGLQTTEYLASE